MLTALGIALAVGAVWIARRELRLYRAHESGVWKHGTDLFEYSKGRLWVRGLGLVAALWLAITLVAWELVPPRTAGAASAYVVAFALGAVSLLGAGIADLVVTFRTARPGEIWRQSDSTGREDPRR